MRPLLTPAISLLLTSGLLAQYVPNLDVKSMLQGLQELKQKHTQTSKSELAQTINDFSAAAADDSSALNFYIEGVRVTQFVGQAREDTAFHDWKKREAGKLSGPAIRMCLRYTTLSLQRAAGATDKQIFPPLLSYAQEAQSLLPAISGQEIARQPVTDNLFVRWYGVGDKFAGLQDWPLSPMDVDGIYTRVLLPIMRTNRDPRIIQYWDAKLAEETSRASTAAAAFSTDRFNQSRRPELLWSRAEDLVAIGRRDQGISEMYNIVKNFPGHPSAGKWIDELQALLEPAPAPAAAAVSGTTGTVVQ